MGDSEIRGGEALNEWVTGINTILHGLDFKIELRPITDDDYLVVRWKAQGAYGAGFTGTPPEAIGKTVTFTGTDTLRVADGELAEYWANAACPRRRGANVQPLSCATPGTSPEWRMSARVACRASR